MAEEDVVIIGMRDVLRRLSYLRHDIDSPKVLNEIGLFLTHRIEVRTLAGKNVNKQKFVPYSPKYEKMRKDEGRKTKPPNLFMSGSMMSALTFEEIDGGVRLFFQNTSDREGVRNPEKAFWHNTGAEPNPKREFFAISDEDREKMIGIIDRHINRLSRRRR